MPRPQREIDPDSLISHFGGELRVYRNEAGLSQAQLAKALGCSPQWIAQVEVGDKKPSKEFAHDLDTYFQTNGVFFRLWKTIERARRRLIVPQWFREWVDIEKKTHTLRTWEPLVVPGLLQVSTYARAVLSRPPGVTEEQVEQWVAERLDRQEILSGEKPTKLWAVLDERVLSTPIGDVRVMREQMAYLIDVAARPNIRIHILPQDAGGGCGLAGAFVIGSLHDSPDIVYLESHREGRITDHPEDIAEMNNRYSALSADALSARESLQLIKKVMEERWAQT